MELTCPLKQRRCSAAQRSDRCCTGRSTIGDNVLEYIVSLDSRSVTCLVSRSRLLLTRDQAAVMAENRAQPTTLALGSPARALSLGQ